MLTNSTLISVIIPVFNGSKWVDHCFESIRAQSLSSEVALELCICNDSSTDNSEEMINNWLEIFKEISISVKYYKSAAGVPKGVGFAKNKAVGMSTGTYLCFQDIDDIMLPGRIMEQYTQAIRLPVNTLIGSQFVRVPAASTVRYTKWANSLPLNKLHVQIYTSHGPTVIMPTWFCHRSVFDKVGAFSEGGSGTPEDLIFFYKHLDLGGGLFRVEIPLLVYTYHASATTFSINEQTIWKLRLDRLQNQVLNNWSQFTIWNAGKQGRRLYNCLNSTNQAKVRGFCDVDVGKIGRKYVHFDEKTRETGRAVDIVHFKDATGPFVVCVKMDMTNGEFEANLASLGLEETTDYVWFS